MAATTCADCGRRYNAYEGEQRVRIVCGLCWVRRFPTREAREMELRARGIPARKRLVG
jgi:hypothetical protein